SMAMDDMGGTPAKEAKPTKENKTAKEAKPTKKRIRTARSVGEFERFLRPPQLRKPPGPEDGHKDRSRSPKHDRGNGAKPLRGKTGLELTEFVGSADKDGIHGVHAPAHFVGRAQLDEQLANDNTDHVCRSHEKECEERDV